MPDSPNNVHIVVPKELRDRLKALKKSHQALAGVIEDLLDQSKQIQPKHKKG